MKTLLLIALLCVMVNCLLAQEDTEGKRRRGKKGPQEGCSGWTWQPCVPAEGDCGLGQRQGTQEGPNCKILSKTIKCRIPCGRRKEYGDCRYRRAPWEECDADTNMESRTLELKRAVKGATCESEVVQTRVCKGACKYQKKEATDCNEESNTFTVTKQLKEGDPTLCQQEIVKTKRCKDKMVGDGEAVTGKAAKKAAKKAARKEARKAARKEKRAKKPEINGEAATPKGPCQYGAWSEFGECVDNKQTRTRPIMSGAEKRRCQQRATQVRNC
ncbi:pleiotrophin-A-like [Branchiostoma floridae]|uniref:Pleiotrophin-A-like n=1 Tax=Branchiostoma floridae TaxID=7739 RepID=A0A9J7HRL7_BRAFL|nr:pleiotrophin-A-like [Branchiostoma floridae]